MRFNLAHVLFDRIGVRACNGLDALIVNALEGEYSFVFAAVQVLIVTFQLFDEGAY